jgi:multidrug resistance efflux pump
MSVVKYTAGDLRDALDLAKPGRILELDYDGNMSKNCVAAVIHNLCALAEAYKSAKAELEAQAIDPNSRENLCQENAMLRNDLELARKALRAAETALVVHTPERTDAVLCIIRKSLPTQTPANQDRT